MGDDLLFKELIARDKRKFRLEDYLFDKQVAFVRDPAPFATAVCSRRAGKTVACAADMVDTCMRIAGAVCLYITLTRDNAKKIVWKELKEINRVYGLGAKANETELSLVFPNKAVIYLSGAKDKSEIEKFRGLALALCYIDECQSFRSHIQELVDDVISKALFDYDGRLRLTGTPGPVPVGYFHSCATSKEWSNHKWTMFDNPWLKRKSGKTALELMQRDLKRKGVSATDPSIRRECYGEWTVDLNSLVVRYDPTTNHFEEPPTLTHYVLGVDLGHDDADAIAVIGWNENSPKCYLVEEFLKRGQGITELADNIDKFIAIFNPVKVVMDTGGLGKKIAEELRRRRALPIVAAEKARKFEFIELMNDALRTSLLMAKKTSTFAQDSTLLEWDKDAKLDKPKVKDTFHSDIIDAVLYAYREAMHWLYKPEVAKPAFKSNEYYKAIEAEMEANAGKSKQTEDELEGFEPLNPFDKWPV